jgi:endoglucanase
MKKKNVLRVSLRFRIVLGTVMLLVSSVPAQSQNVWSVDSAGNINLNGVQFMVKGVSWTGLEGRELPADMDTPPGAPMELYMGNVSWFESSRTYDQDISEIKSMGFNVVRLPIVPQTLDPADPQGRDPYLKNSQSVRIENARLALETVIKKLNTAGIYVILDIDSCSNYVGWRAGRLDARPPYPDGTWTDYDHKREECSCSATNNPLSVTRIQAYDSTKWLADLRTLAGLRTELGVSNIMGIDILNEPWDYTWAEWKSLIEQAYQAINPVNSYILMFVQGIWTTAGYQDGTPNTTVRVPHGVETFVPNKGENLFEAGTNPPAVPKTKLVFAPHVFGPSVFVQSMFMDPNQPACAGLDGENSGDAGCNIVINPAIIEQGWEEHFGYLKDMGYAVVIGECGGNMDWPHGADLRTQNRYSYLTDFTLDLQWQMALAHYLVNKRIASVIYRAINPETRYTGGIYRHAYDPITNTNGWGVWSSTDARKLQLAAQLWSTPPLATPGDVNGDYRVDIVDALLTAQYYVGIRPPVFFAANADVDCSGTVTIVDALRVAQYYVGILSSLACSCLC